LTAQRRTNVYYIAICDDDTSFTAAFNKRLSSVLASKNIAAEIEDFPDTASFLRRLESGRTFYLIFLDIYLGGENGYFFAKQLRREAVGVDIVFITTTESYAVAGYDVSPILYLVKPFQDDQIAYALDIFLKKHQPSQILLDLTGEFLSLDAAHILYIEVYGHKSCLHMASGENRELRIPLNRLEQQLPSSAFVRSHQSYLVNMGYIQSVARYQLTLSNGLTLPISQSKYLNLQNSFILYVKQQKLWL